MALDKSTIDSQALDWVIRLRAPDFEDWEAFEAWMAADPRHAETYQEMAVADQDMAEILATPVPRPIVATPEPRRAIGRRAWIGGAVAACLAVAVGFEMVDHKPSLYRIETGPGEQRTVSLAEGTTIKLNGGTRITLDHDDIRHVELERGEAVFAVVHDEVKPFRVVVGDATLLDVGTRFNVVRDGGVTSVQVSEGAVVYNPDKQAVRLDPGATLRAVDGQTKLALGHVRPAFVAGWETGQLVYEARPMEEVAADLSRWSGKSVSLAPQLTGRPFSGALDLRSARSITDFAAVLDVKIDPSGGGWALSPAR